MTKESFDPKYPSLLGIVSEFLKHPGIISDYCTEMAMA